MTTGVIQGDLVDMVDERPVHERVLPMPTVELLRHQVAKLLSSTTSAERLPALIVTWMAPMIADRDHAIKKLRWLHAEQRWKLDRARVQLMGAAAELAELREQLAATGRGMWLLLGELAGQAEQVAATPDGVLPAGENACPGCDANSQHYNGGLRCTAGERS